MDSTNAHPLSRRAFLRGGAISGTAELGEGIREDTIFFACRVRKV